MTMFPSQNLSKQRRYGGGGGGGGFGYDCCSESDLVMVGTMATPDQQDESRTESDVNEEQEEEAGPSSKGALVQDHEQGWLQLGIGGGHNTNHNNKPDPTVPVAAEERRDGLVELNLLPSSSSSFGGGGGGRGSGSISQPNIAPPMFHLPNFRGFPRQVPSMASTSSTYNNSSSLYLQTPSYYQNQNQNQNQNQYMNQINWAFRHRPQNLMVGSPSNDHHQSYPAWINPPGSYFNARPFQVLQQVGVDVAGPSLDFRIIDPPRRPHSGIWFMLQASQNQSKEPFLPQVPKSFLRIKDGKMTVRLLMKYLANKLKLDNESEIEITCRGQQLLPFLTLQHVRDSIWNSRRDDGAATINLLPESSTTDHVMVLHYARSA